VQGGTHRCGRARSAGGHIDLAKPWDTDTIRDASCPLRPTGRSADSEHVRGRLRRAFSARQALRLSDHQPPADLTLEAGRAWRAPRRSTSRPCRGRQRLVGRTTSQHSGRRVPGEIAGEDARPAGCGTGPRRGASTRRALVPAPQVRSMVGRWSSRRRPMEPDDVARALAARDRNACGRWRAGRLYLRVDY